MAEKKEHSQSYLEVELDTEGLRCDLVEAITDCQTPKAKAVCH